MKLILISDTHATAPGKRVHTIDPVERLQLCVTTIKERLGDADLCVMMGDLVEDPTAEAYDVLLECVAPLPMPIRFLIGNHDDRDVLLQQKPDIERDSNGYVQSCMRTDDGMLLFLDTGETGEHAGSYTGEKLQWLAAQLDAAGSAPVYLFMHHPPFATGFYTDASKLVQSEELYGVLQQSTSIKHIFVGHMHRAASGTWRGYAWTSLHGTCYENDLTFSPAKPNRMSGPAQIGIALLDRGDVVLHFHDVLSPYAVVGTRR